MIKEQIYETIEYTIDDTVLAEVQYYENKIVMINIFAECITSKNEFEKIEEIIKHLKSKEWK